MANKEKSTNLPHSKKIRDSSYREPGDSREVHNFALVASGCLQRTPIPGASASTLAAIDSDLHGSILYFESRGAADKIHVTELDTSAGSAECVRVALVDEDTELTETGTGIALSGKVCRLFVQGSRNRG